MDSKYASTIIHFKEIYAESKQACPERISAFYKLVKIATFQNELEKPIPKIGKLIYGED